MNKILTFAGIAALFLASCTSEEAPYAVAPKEYATIELGISNDPDMKVTRASQTADNAQWFAKVGEEDWVAANTLVGKTYEPSTYTIQVGNYKTEADAYANTVNGGAGDAYYTATRNDVALVKGTNTVEFNCGTAKNARIAYSSTVSGVAGLTINNVVATQAAKNRTYTFSSNSTAYFYAGTAIVCQINYTYNSVQKNIEKTFSAPSAATEYALTVSANTNGTITTLTINYDDAFDPGASEAITIDAATGAEAQ